jgi:uncharacterized protein (DUF927 family)
MTKKKLTIAEPALKEKSGKVDPAPSKAWSHSELEAADDLKKKKVTEGFETNTGKFVSRKKAAKIAEAAGEIKKPVKKLHSTDLRVGAGIKKKKLK